MVARMESRVRLGGRMLSVFLVLVVCSVDIINPVDLGP